MSTLHTAASIANAGPCWAAIQAGVRTAIVRRPAKTPATRRPQSWAAIITSSIATVASHVFHHQFIKVPAAMEKPLYLAYEREARISTSRPGQPS